MLKDWYFSIILLITYILTFHFWMLVSYKLVLISGICVTFSLCIFIVWAQRRGYFANLFDMALHGFIILDILLETVIVKDHDHYGFYLCALAFSLVLGWYRYKKLQVRPMIPFDVTTQPTIVQD